jgi:hypothetical protein
VRSNGASDIQLVLETTQSLGADDATRLKLRQYVDHCSFNAMLDVRYALACHDDTNTDGLLKSNWLFITSRQAKAYRTFSLNSAADVPQKFPEF